MLEKLIDGDSSLSDDILDSALWQFSAMHWNNDGSPQARSSENDVTSGLPLDDEASSFERPNDFKGAKGGKSLRHRVGLRCLRRLFELLRNGEPFLFRDGEPAPDGVIDHSHRFFERLTVRETAGQGGDSYRVPAFRLGSAFQNDAVPDHVEWFAHDRSIISRAAGPAGCAGASCRRL